MQTYRRFAASLVLVGALAGCTATYTQGSGGGFSSPQVVVGTPGGFYPLYTPAALPALEPSLSAPPGFVSRGATPLPSPVPGSLDGTYDGVATLLQNDYGDCAFRFSVTNMHVRHGHVRFASFRGRIGPDGGVRMADGAMNWITGHFVDGHFSGSYSNEYCAYWLSLNRVGS